MERASRASEAMQARSQSQGAHWLSWLVVAPLIGVVGCTKTFGESALFPPHAEPLPEMSEHVSRRNLTLTTADGVALRGFYLEKPDTQRTVLFFYGNRSSVLTSLWTLYWLVDALNANVVALDYRGYGFSSGTASVDKFVEDALEIQRYAAETLRRKELPMVVMGQSMGSASALHVAANRDVDSVVLMAPLGSVEDLLEAVRQQAPWYVSIEPDASLKNLRVVPMDDVARVREKTLFIAGNDDTLASPAVVDRLMAKSGAQTKVACRVPGGHGDVRAENPEVRKCITSFLGANVK